MMRIGNCVVLLALLAVLGGTQSACGQGGNKAAVNATATPLPTPSRSIAAADVVKLKWIEGTWRGMDGQNPFFERYRLEGTSLVVDSFTDATLAKVESSGAFELKDGEFGKTEGSVRSAAAFITDDAVQFAPAVAGKGNYFRFERQKDGTWNAVLEWPATADKPARQKIYKMETYSPGK
jgi:hypothetical protein